MSLYLLSKKFSLEIRCTTSVMYRLSLVLKGVSTGTELPAINVSSALNLIQSSLYGSLLAEPYLQRVLGDRIIAASAGRTVLFPFISKNVLQCVCMKSHQPCVPECSYSNPVGWVVLASACITCIKCSIPPVRYIINHII